MTRFGYISRNFGDTTILALIAIWLVLQLFAFHGVAIAFDTNYLISIVGLCLFAAIVPLSEIVIAGLGIYGAIDLVMKL